MGCGVSEPEDLRTRELDAQLKRDLAETRLEHKILLLGAGGCGKSTIMKQMKAINNDEFTDSEIKEFTVIIRENLVNCCYLAAKASYELGYDLERKDIQALADYFRNLRKKDIDEIAEKGLEGDEVKEMIEKIDSFWHDKQIQEIVKRGNEYNLLESAVYFVEKVGANKILRTDYVPTHLDIVHSRRATEAITECTLVDTKNGSKIKIVDVGGQRDRRKKWIRCFDKVTLIVFVASLSEYNMVLEEDTTRNRLFESLDLFEGVTNMSWFRSTPIVLFLNKYDIFQQKIKEHDLPFTDYEGGSDPEAAFNYIRSHFEYIKMGIESQDDATMYVYPTVAVDKNNIEKIWHSVKDVILSKNMLDFGMSV